MGHLERLAFQFEGLRRRRETLRSENAELRRQTERNPFTIPDKVARYAAQAQAEGVSLPVMQRLLKILQLTRPPR